MFWNRFIAQEARDLWQAKLKAFGERNQLFPGDNVQADYIRGLQQLVAHFVESTKLYPASLALPAGEYLFHELIAGDSFIVTQEADRLSAAFEQHLVSKGREEA